MKARTASVSIVVSLTVKIISVYSIQLGAYAKFGDVKWPNLFLPLLGGKAEKYSNATCFLKDVNAKVENTTDDYKTRNFRLLITST